MASGELSVDDAWRTMRRLGVWSLLRQSFLRLRYGDGFSHARALGLLMCLAAVPFLIALTGLASELGAGSGGRILADTVLALTPGASEDLVRDLLSSSERVEDAGELALWLGLVAGMLSLTTAMAQIERGANRIYGVERDRPALEKYMRGFVLAVLAGLPTFAGFLLLVGGDAFGDSAKRSYHWGSPVEEVFDTLRYPISLALTVCGVSVLFRYAPRRRQPTLSWLVVGAGLATAVWWLVSAGLAAYVGAADVFGTAYGASTGIMALLLWANLTGLALFFGLAFAAQLEAGRIGVPGPVMPDRWQSVGERVEASRGL
jgi:YihY family inner membrane protein